MLMFKIGSKLFEVLISSYDEIQNILLQFDIKTDLKIGFIDYYSQKIYVRNDVHLDLQNECILHELIHAMLLDSGIDSITDNMNEILSSIIAPRLLQFIRDNKQLIIDL